ncbi:MAG: hypothetical protein ACP5JJ_19225 [Anaerolineae bacterium]
MPSRRERPQLHDEPWADPGPLPASGTNGELIQGIVLDLLAKQKRLSLLIDNCLADDHPPVQDLARLLAIHSQNAARLGRLLRDKHALSDRAADAMARAIDHALDELSEEWGLEL